MTAEELGQMIWNVKELLRNVYDNKDVEDVILPFTLLRRLDCVLVGSEALVATNMKQLEELGQTSQEDIDNMMPMLMDAAGYKFYNTSGLSLSKLITVPADLTNNFKTYLEGFSPNIREILKNFTGKGENASLSDIFSNLARKNLLLQVTKAFVLNIDLMRFLDYRNASGAVCTGITWLSAGYLVQSTTSAPLQLVPVLRVDTDVYSYYVNIVSGEVSRVSA